MPITIPGFAPTRTVHSAGDDGLIPLHVKPPAFIGGEGVTVHLTSDQYIRYCQWQDGDGLIQDLLPDLSDSQREALMTGMSGEDFAAACGPEDEEPPAEDALSQLLTDQNPFEGQGGGLSQPLRSELKILGVIVGTFTDWDKYDTMHFGFYNFEPNATHAHLPKGIFEVNFDTGEVKIGDYDIRHTDDGEESTFVGLTTTVWEALRPYKVEKQS